MLRGINDSLSSGDFLKNSSRGPIGLSALFTLCYCYIFFSPNDPPLLFEDDVDPEEVMKKPFLRSPKVSLISLKRCTLIVHREEMRVIFEFMTSLFELKKIQLD